MSSMAEASSSLVVICAVGLTPDHLGTDTPCLSALASRGFAAPLTPSLPAVTTTCQTTMLTGVDPSVHGIVGNGWHFRELGEVWLWRQSQGLIQAPCVWQRLRQRRPGLKVLKHFWWYALHTDCDAVVTPRPVYHHDGRKSPDCYAWPESLKRDLDARHGSFPLFQFWGPGAGIASTRWIADSFATAWDHSRPDLALVYLPHLDYDLQRYGPSGPHLAANLRDLDACCRTVCEHARSRGAQVLVVSEYGIEGVSQGVAINRRLREAGLLVASRNAAGELLDVGASRAFAVCDHQLAHISCKDSASVEAARRALTGLAGIERVYGPGERHLLGLEHPRAGELIAVAAPGCWFQYDYWLDEAARPDFARCVEIHKKPGYDPRELLFDPAGGRRRAAWALLRKMLGFRYVMDPISLDPGLVHGSHGRPPASPGQGPLILGSDPGWRQDTWHQRDVAGLIERILS